MESTITPSQLTYDIILVLSTMHTKYLSHLFLPKRLYFCQLPNLLLLLVTQIHVVVVVPMALIV